MKGRAIVISSVFTDDRPRPEYPTSFSSQPPPCHSKNYIFIFQTPSKIRQKVLPPLTSPLGSVLSAHFQGYFLPKMEHLMKHFVDFRTFFTVNNGRIPKICADTSASLHLT